MSDVNSESNNAEATSFNSNAKGSFWKKHSNKLPGSVKAVTSTAVISSENVPKVIGAGHPHGTRSPNSSTNALISTSSISKSNSTTSNKRVPTNPEKPLNFATFLAETHQDWNESLDNDLSLSKSSKHVKEDRTAAEIYKINAQVAKIDKFKLILNSENIDLLTLKKLGWSGIPAELRPIAWKLLMGYLPCNSSRRDGTLERKRKEYEDSVTLAFQRGDDGLDQTIWRQIVIDIPRTNPAIPLYQDPKIQRSLERILYCWAIRHPASGYVQGINDLVTPFFHVFLSQYIKEDDPSNANVEHITESQLATVEADSFWCLTKLLDGIQDNYTYAQPGIQQRVAMLKDLVHRVDAPLHEHLQNQGVEFIQFAFRWMNCLLMRELSIRNIIRMWDTYLSEGSDGFSVFHTYVCAAFLLRWSEQLRKLEFQDIMMLLQNLPTSKWEETDVEMILSQAYLWKSLFHDTHHLSDK